MSRPDIDIEAAKDPSVRRSNSSSDSSNSRNNSSNNYRNSNSNTKLNTSIGRGGEDAIDIAVASSEEVARRNFYLGFLLPVFWAINELSFGEGSGGRDREAGVDKCKYYIFSDTLCMYCG